MYFDPANMAGNTSSNENSTNCTFRRNRSKQYISQNISSLKDEIQPIIDKYNSNTLQLSVKQKLTFNTRQQKHDRQPQEAPQHQHRANCFTNGRPQNRQL